MQPAAQQLSNMSAVSPLLVIKQTVSEEKIQPAFLRKNLVFQQDDTTKHVETFMKDPDNGALEEAILEIQGALLEHDLPPIVSEDQ